LDSSTIPVGSKKGQLSLVSAHQSLSIIDPVLWSYPAEVQTFTLRSKGLLLWNQLTQLWGGYTTWVDSIGLAKIGKIFCTCPDPMSRSR
jgi:hypothetical protein